MPKSKVYLNSVYRTPLVNEDRRGFLRLNMNEYVPGLPEDIVKSVIKNINADTLSAYPEYYSLIQKIAQYNNVGFENICLTNGSDSAIKYVFDAYISRGDKVLYANPTFAMYPVYCKSHGADEVVVDYKNDLSFPKKEFVEHLMNDQINLAIIVNPANPTGSILTKDDLLEILDITKKKDVLLIIDEAYFYFHPETLIQEIKRYNNLVVLRTFSKLCSIAAARIGYVTASEEIVKNIYKVKPSYDVNILAILLANKLLDNTRILEQL
ncbi:MAG: pyridoxal phosphate-dependent aminotransferase, partial [Bacteroidota bacterium]